MKAVEPLSGTVFSIQRFSIHDGPGIRTTVFLKGCPSRCFWCHNPEGLASGIEPEFMTHKCIGCGRCAAVCPSGALKMENGALHYEKAKCKACLACTEACLIGACVPSACRMKVEEVMQEVLEDRSAYADSGGGITLSGGEPLLQADFCRALLESAREQGINTAIETAGSVPWNHFLTVLPFVDYMLMDIKHLDEEAHSRGTGISNNVILANAAKLIEMKKRSGDRLKVIFRTPVIPSFNDSEEEILKIAAFIKSLGENRLVLLPFHKLGAAKYTRFGLTYSAAGLEPFSKGKLERLQAVADSVLS